MTRRGIGWGAQDPLPGSSGSGWTPSKRVEPDRPAVTPAPAAQKAETEATDSPAKDRPGWYNAALDE